jgi:cell wall assembly regulator SMI1
MNLINSATKISEENIIKIENDLDIKFPKDYKNFMININGGVPEEDMLYDFYDEVSEIENTSIIREFFSLYVDDTILKNNLKIIYNTMKNEKTISADMIPIADDPAGNIIGLSLNKDDYGFIYYLNHEFEDVETGYLIKSKIANSFKDFIDNLYADE